jgi:hypothetical protein
MSTDNAKKEDAIFLPHKARLPGLLPGLLPGHGFPLEPSCLLSGKLPDHFCSRSAHVQEVLNPMWPVTVSIILVE